MMSYDGQNPNSILVMDNCSVHHVHEVVDANPTVWDTSILPATIIL